MKTLKLGELCAGYGGLGLAVEEVLGAELAWYSEFDAAPSKIMATHWPEIPNHGDMTQIDWAAIEAVDIISGGTPCQDLSAAGRRKGMTEGTRSNLWVNMREAIATIKPTYVVWENVRGAYSAKAVSDLEFCAGCMGAGGRADEHVLRALGRVLGDLSDLGYDTQWRGLRAADVGAPHGRYRVFVLATHRDHLGGHGAGVGPEQDGRGQPADSRSQALPHSPGNGRDQWRTESTRQQGRPDASKRSASAFADPEGRRRGIRQWHDLGKTCGEVDSPRNNCATAIRKPGAPSEAVDWGDYAPAIRRWESMRGAAPTPVELSPTDKPRLSPFLTEWMMGLPKGWITDVPGIGWADQLKVAGNGVVPQQAVAAIRDMLACSYTTEARIAA